MRKALNLIGTGLVAAALLSCGGNQVGIEGGEHVELSGAQYTALESAVAAVKPTIVRIKVVEPSYYDGRENRFVAFGSGTIITPDGHIMTNHHVAGKAAQLMVTMPNREEVPAILIGTDPATDIAIIKLQPDTPTTYPYTEFGDSSTVKVGDPVLALGSPVALSQSVTLGIVSNAEMVMPPSFGGSTFELDGEDVGSLVRWIGHDAAIFPGNSGGPLINLEGKIIGVNEIGIGLGGAIPGNLAREVAMKIIEKGRVTRAYSGFAIQPLLKSSPIQEGVLVSSVFKDGPAEKAGVMPGDIMTAIAGEPIIGRFREDLPAINNLVAGLDIGKPASVALYRDGQRMELKLTPEERQSALVPEEALREWGITARNLTLWTQLDLAREEKGGVLVTSVSSGAPVSRAKPDIRSDDVITRVNDTRIDTVEQLVSMTSEVVAGARSPVPVLVTFERDAEVFLTVVNVGIEDLPAPGREVRKAWLPLETQPLTRETAEKLGIPKARGVRITRLYDLAGDDYALQVGDIITHVDDDPLDVSKIEDSQIFETLIRQYPLGQEVDFRILRDGEKMDVSVALVETPERSREVPRYRDLDFDVVVREATFNDRKEPTLAGVEFSVVADSVPEGGWASLAGLQVGDAILSIDGEKISKVDDVKRKLDEARAEKARTVVLFIRRESQNMYLEIEPSW